MSRDLGWLDEDDSKKEAKKKVATKSKPELEFEGPEESSINLKNILVNLGDLVKKLQSSKFKDIEDEIDKSNIEIPLGEIKLLIRSAKSKWLFGKGRYPNMEVIIKNVVNWTVKIEKKEVKTDAKT